MTTNETRATGRRPRARRARALGWAAVLATLLLAPLDALAQKDKGATPSRSSSGSSARSSSGSSARSSSGSSVRSSSAPSRSSSSAPRGSSGSARSTASMSRSVSAAQSKPSVKAPSRGTAPSSSRPIPSVDPRVKTRPPVRTQDASDPRWVPKGDPNDDRNHRPSPGYGHRHRPYYPSFYPLYPFYPFSPYRSYYGSYYPYYSYGPYGYYFHPYAYGASYRQAPRYGDSMGGLDLNVRPKKAEVYIDGRPVGPVDRYDGFPSYLWLEPGTYELSFYLEGYETLTRRYSIYPGVVIDVEESLAPGTAVTPEPPDLGELPYGEEPSYGEPPAEPPAAGPGPVDGEEVGRLQLSIRPGDTAIYLDGHFLGTAEELSQLSAGLVVEPGGHVLELVRPGYVTEELPIEVPAGERVDVDLTLRQR